MTWPFQSDLERIQKSERARYAAKKGNKAEDIARSALEAAGYVHIEPIERSWIIRWGFDPKAGKKKVVGAIPKKTVSGDFTAIQPGAGKYVHVEVKARDGDKLQYSVFKRHQIEALEAKNKAGAICLIAWVRGSECNLYRWPVEGFGPGKSLKWK